MLDFRDGAFDSVDEMMGQAEDLVVLYNDMGAMGIDRMKSKSPERVINVGISEQNLISVAAGLALAGKRAIVYGIIPHVTGRCYEQIKIDLCTMQLPVTILGIGSGLSYGVDGPTHHAIHDIALMRTLPGMSVYNPADAVTAAACVKLALAQRTPAYIRLDKDQHQAVYAPDFDFARGWNLVKPGKRVLLISTGIVTHQVIGAARKLHEEGVDVGVLDWFCLKPVNESELVEVIASYDGIMTFEEHIFFGGIGSAVSEMLQEQNLAPRFKSFHLKEDIYLGATGRKKIGEQRGLTADTITANVRDFILRLP